MCEYIVVNVITDESTRVSLQPIRGVEGSDYINASFVDVSAKPINQSINLYLSQAKAHTNAHAHTHTQNTTTMYNKGNKKETAEMKHIHCQVSDTIDVPNETVHRTI